MRTMNEMLSKAKRVLGLPDWNQPRPLLEDGEAVMFEGRVAFATSLTGARMGRLILTNRRLLWHDVAGVVWPFKAISGELDLRDIGAVDKGTFLDFVGGGRRLRLRLRNGKDKCFFEAEGRLDEWIAMIRKAIAESEAA